MTARPKPLDFRMRTAQRWSLAFGTAGILASIAGGWFDRVGFFSGYLFAFVFWVGLSLGAMAILMVHYQVGGSWGYVTRRILEAATRTLPLMAVLFIPLLFGLRDLYPWARPEAVRLDPLLRHQEPYLNVGFFTARSVFYFACWIACASFLNRWSALQDRDGDPRLRVWLRRLSGPGLVLYAVTMYFAATDWVMSTEPHWSSTIYGMIFLASQGLSAFALATALLVLLSSDRPLSQVATPGRLNDLGNLLLTTVMLWAYVSFSQYLIIWAENLPREIRWYVHRSSSGWKAVAFGLIAFHFAVPFLLLLFRAVKRSPAWIAGLAWGLLAMRLVDDFWRVVPPFVHDGRGLSWIYLTAPVGIGGLWIALFLFRLRRRPLLPLGDSEFAPVLEEAKAYA